MVAACIEQIECAVDIGREVELRGLDGRAHTSAGSNVDDLVKVALSKGALDQDRIAYIASDKFDLVPNGSNVSLFDLGIVVIIE